MCKHWEAKLVKINFCADNSITKNPKRKINLFLKAEFTIRWTLIISAACCNQSELVLFAISSNSEYVWDVSTY